jgi:hypothetical protein
VLAADEARAARQFANASGENGALGRDPRRPKGAAISRLPPWSRRNMFTRVRFSTPAVLAAPASRRA